MAEPSFHYSVEPEKIRAYQQLTAEQKLQWLGEIFEFTEAALSPKARRVRQKLREAGTWQVAAEQMSAHYREDPELRAFQALDNEDFAW